MIKKSKESLKAFYKDLYLNQHIPFCIERTEDKAILLLNNDFITYSYSNIDHEGKWSYLRLFHDYRIKDGDFKVISRVPIENIFNYPQKYFTKESQIIVNYRAEIDKNDKKIDKFVKKIKLV